MLQITAVGKLHRKRLATNRWMGKINRVGSGITLRRINGDKFSAVRKLNRLLHSQVGPPPPLPPQARALNHLNERLRAAIQNRQFQVVEFDDRIVHAYSHQGREQVLRGGNEDALFHQAGGVADLGHVVTHGFDFEAV